MTKTLIARRRPCAAVVALLSIVLLPMTAQAAAAPDPVPHGTLAERAHSLLGLVVFAGLAWTIGRLAGARARVPTRTIVWGFALQFAFGAIVVWNRTFLVAINAAVDALLGFTREGAAVVFGDLIQNNIPVGSAGGGMVPFTATPGSFAHAGAYFACFVLPTIIFFSALTAVAYHSGVMQYVVQGHGVGDVQGDEDQRG